jgi:hypothetical protein
MRILYTLLLALSLPAAAMAETAATTTTRTTATRPSARPTRPPTPAQAAQHQRMRDCNAEARRRSLTGTLRTEFMRPCLGGRMPPAAG